MDRTKAKSSISLYPLDDPNPFGRDKELSKIEEHLSNRTNIILLGSRRVGKTSLLNAIKKRKEGKYKIINYNCGEHGKINLFFAKLFASATISKIFVSSIGKKDKGELAKERKSAEEIIKEQGCKPFLIENILDSDCGTEVEEKNIKDSTAFLLILGNEESDEVKKEYEFAIKHDIPILCFVKGLGGVERGVMKEIIKDIRENKRGIYKRYESISEFEKVLKDTLKEKTEEWKQKRITRCADDFRAVGDSFFTSIKNQKDKNFLILVDELGELKRYDNEKFNEFLPYFKTKLEEMEVKNCTFVVTGSENVFTTTYQKYLGQFKHMRINKFDNKIAKNFITNELGWSEENKYLDKIIEVCGTVPKDLAYFILELKRYEEANFGDKEIRDILLNIIENSDFSEFKIDKQYLYLDKDTINFLKDISEHLAASKNEIFLYAAKYAKNLNEILEKVCEEQFILEEKNGRYEFVSKLLWWRVIYYKDKEKFEKLLENLLKNG